MSATAPLSLDQQDAQVLASLASRGKIGGQISHQLMLLGQETAPGEYAARQEAHAATVVRLIQDGSAAWRVANPAPGRPKVLYTPEPINPQTGRMIGAYLWMTPLAVICHGRNLYDAYQASIHAQQKMYPQIEVPLDRAAFEAKLLLDTVPVAPKFASLVPAEILAATVPARKPKQTSAPPGTTPQGHVATLGPRNSEAIASNHDSGPDLLDKLDRWNVGPGTQLHGRYADAGPGLSPTLYIERAAIVGAGVAGVDWLVKKGFAPTADWYSHAFGIEEPECLPVLDAIKATGADPKSRVGGTIQRTLWHDLTAWHNYSTTPARIDWLKAAGVDWSIADIAGELPLTGLLRRINSKVDSADLMAGDSPLGDFMRMARGMTARVPGLAETLVTESVQEKKDLAALTDLASDMVQSGVDPMQKALDGSYPWQAIVPSQMRAETLIRSRLPHGEAYPDGAVMRELFFGDRAGLHKDRAAYSAQMVAFIERMEQASGLTLLAPLPPPPAQAAPPASRPLKP